MSAQHLARRSFVLGLSTSFSVALVMLVMFLTPLQAAPLRAAHAATGGGPATAVITIGVGAALSGPIQWLGWRQVNSVQLAVSQTNAAGGINIGGVTYTVALVAADSGCNTTQAITAANTLLNAGAVAVVGHTCSSDSMAAQPLYAAAGVPMLSPSATLPQLTEQGYTTTFRTVSHDGSPPAMLARFLRGWTGTASAAIVDGPIYVPQPGDYFSSTFVSLGGTVTSRRTVTNTNSFTATLLLIQVESPQVIVYTDPDPAHAGEFSAVAYRLGMTNVTIAWTSGTEDRGELATYAMAAGANAAAGDVAVMYYHYPTYMPGWYRFLPAYQAANFAHEPNDPGTFGPFAYDAAEIIFAAIDRANSTNPADVRDEVAATNNYPGIVGLYQGFDANGDVVPQWAWLEQFRSGDWVWIYPARVMLPGAWWNFGP
jgi:branched-chain amino acid transport system substrate-binding protein